MIVAVLAACTAPLALSRGVTPYLPLGTSPEKERDYERVLILAGKPVLRRPVPAAVVLDALSTACQLDLQLCRRVRGYLTPYQTKANVTQLTVEADATAGGTDRALPNAHGRTAQSNWAVAGAAHYQPNGYVLLNVGGVASDDEATPTGTVISLGTDFAQLDIGYRDHWFSPSALSSFPISTEAPTMPSITLSNYRPLTRLGVSYEFFAARMSRQENIVYLDSTSDGYPQLAGIQVGLEPATGYGLTLNRVMQYGGGARGGAGLSRLWKAFFNSNSPEINIPNAALGQQEFGNQVASVAATMQFPGKVPFSVSMEYAGEDNNYEGDLRLGDTALSLGFDFPVLWNRFDLRYEVSEWQNVWYTHHLYPKGLSNKGFVLGHWFGDQKQFGDRVGGHSQVLQLGMRTDAGAYWQATYRQLEFVTSFGFQTRPVPYETLRELSLRYSTVWNSHGLAGELSFGQDALGKKLARLGVSLDLTRSEVGPAEVAAYESPEVADDLVEFFVDVGANRSQVNELLSGSIPRAWTDYGNGYHLGIGARRTVGKRSRIGVRLELDRVDSHSLISLRAVDYQFRLMRHLAASTFFGVGRYNYGAPAFGWYGGIGLQLTEIRPKWDIGFDWRAYDKLSRNPVLPSDPRSPGFDAPRLYFDVRGLSLYITRRF